MEGLQSFPILSPKPGSPFLESAFLQSWATHKKRSEIRGALDSPVAGWWRGGEAGREVDSKPQPLPYPVPTPLQFPERGGGQTEGGSRLLKWL